MLRGPPVGEEHGVAVVELCRGGGFGARAPCLRLLCGRREPEIKHDES